MSSQYSSESGHARRVALLSFSAIADDPRVRRQGDTLAASGWDVTAFGLSGAISQPPHWRIVTIDDERAETARRGPHWRGLLTLNLIPGRILNAFWLILARLGPAHAERAYWKLKPYFTTMAAIAGKEPWDLVIANDWPALGVGLRITREQKTSLLYDTHEFATDEYGHRALWRFFYQPFLLSIERAGVQHAGSVTCVSDGIADALQTVHDMVERPTVIRNIPVSFELNPQPLGETVRVLYHGIVTPGRGLEACIASVAQWPQDYYLTIRGPGSTEYIAELQRQAVESGVSHRVAFAPSVAMTDLVAEASLFDIGLFSMPGHSVQSRFVLPNKFFEYVAAGLALCVSDLEEMQRLVARYDLGVLISDDTPAAIARAIGELDRTAILYFRQNAAKASHELCWERECEKFLKLCDSTVQETAKTLSVSIKTLTRKRFKTSS